MSGTWNGSKPGGGPEKRWDGDTGFVHWINKSMSNNKQSYGQDIQNWLINIWMQPTERLVEYQESFQKLLKMLTGTSYSISGALKWGLMSNGILNLYATIVRLLTLSLEESSYHELLEKFQYLSREYIGDPNVPLEQQLELPNKSSVLYTQRKERINSDKRKFRGLLYWYIP